MSAVASMEQTFPLPAIRILPSCPSLGLGSGGFDDVFLLKANKNGSKRDGRTCQLGGSNTQDYKGKLQALTSLPTPPLAQDNKHCAPSN